MGEKSEQDRNKKVGVELKFVSPPDSESRLRQVYKLLLDAAASDFSSNGSENPVQEREEGELDEH
jgi:hypothetical protein